jgi:hypothetical protein
MYCGGVGEYGSAYSTRVYIKYTDILRGGVDIAYSTGAFILNILIF